MLCSSALRTRQTLEALATELDASPPCEFERELYLASAGDLFSRLQRVPDSVGQLLVIGHNPGIAELAAMLSSSGDVELRRQVRLRYPTGALAELHLAATSWSDLPQGCALAGFAIPRELPAVE